MKLYLVGGFVRDKIMGIPSKDQDFSVVLNDDEIKHLANAIGNVVTPFDFMVDQLKSYGYTIHKEFPEHLTARGKFPREHRSYPGLDADFVLARRDGEYSDGRRPDEVFPGTLEDDLARRDFTMNAIAIDLLGNYIDPYNGRQDINSRTIFAVGDPMDRLREDALRAVRALRFSVTKDMRISAPLQFAMQSSAVLNSMRVNIADERIADELSKMFRYDTVASISILNKFPSLTEAMFEGRRVSLDSTLKTRGRK